MPTSLSGDEFVTIGQMAKLSGVSASALRGYESLGIMAQYGIKVFREKNIRYYLKDDAWKIAQIKAERMSNRNMKLASQGTHRGFS